MLTATAVFSKATTESLSRFKINCNSGAMFRFSVALQILLVFFALIPFVAFGQAIPQFSTVEPHQYDSINLATLGIQLNVPAHSKAGHIPFSVSFTGSSQVATAQLGGFLAFPTLSAQESHFGTPGFSKTSECPSQLGALFTGFFFTDSVGNKHPFARISVSNGLPGNSCGPSTMGSYADDSSGLLMSVSIGTSGGPIYTVSDQNGNVLSNGAFTDPNGNSITVKASGFTDTLNQTAIVLTGGAGTSQTATWTNVLGQNQIVSLTTTPCTSLTAFGCSSDNQPVTGLRIPTSISFPDGSTMGFTWETTYSNSADYRPACLD